MYRICTYVQSREIRFVWGCEKFLPGPAWLLLSKTYKPFSLPCMLYDVRIPGATIPYFCEIVQYMCTDWLFVLELHGGWFLRRRLARVKSFIDERFFRGGGGGSHMLWRRKKGKQANARAIAQAGRQADRPQPQPLHEHACLIGSPRDHRAVRVLRSFRRGPCWTRGQWPYRLAS